MKQIILASSSPRRHELLNLLEIPHQVLPCKEKEKEIPEDSSKTSIQKDFKKELIEVAKHKALCVYHSSLLEPDHPSLIISADTIVVLEGEIIGKPDNLDEAKRMLTKLCGKTHQVFTAICILDTQTDQLSCSTEETRVHMIQCSDKLIDSYLAAEQVIDKAGAYAIQGKGAALIDRIEGCYYNVMGLPLSKLISMLSKMGYNYLK
ncbi:MAG: septum formation protein Maf [Candidatus Heimdallarchaeota archaeon]|nr:septum formation protein Maf [Candidatus Heimdallarchaeota archaeon]